MLPHPNPSPTTGESERQKLKVPFALSKIDSEGVLFFLGILLSIGCLDTAGILKELATFLDNNISSQEVGQPGKTAAHSQPCRYFKDGINGSPWQALSQAVRVLRQVVATAIGMASAVIDNVPLVAATMGMYDVAQYPQDSQLWQLIAYCAGTGGSMLIIGSAAGGALPPASGSGLGP